MSIYVAITRRAEPFDEDGRLITKAEWLRCVEGEPDLRAAAPDEFTSADRTQHV